MSRLPEDLTPSALSKYFETEQAAYTEDELQEWVQEHVVGLLLNDLEKLLSILYRLDVDEQKVKACFLANEPKLIADLIATLIIERERQKVASRLKYRG